MRDQQAVQDSSPRAQHNAAQHMRACTTVLITRGQCMACSEPRQAVLFPSTAWKQLLLHHTTEGFVHITQQYAGHAVAAVLVALLMLLPAAWLHRLSNPTCWTMLCWACPCFHMVLQGHDQPLRFQQRGSRGCSCTPGKLLCTGRKAPRYQAR